MSAFPPNPLLCPTVEKAVTDHALCVLVLPVAILAPYWGKLPAALVLPRQAPYADFFLLVRDPARGDVIDLVQSVRSQVSQ